MSFSPRNVSQLLVGKTVGTVNKDAAVGTFEVIPVVNPAAAVGEFANLGAKLAVKTNNGVKVSDFIPLNAKYNGPLTIKAGQAKSAAVDFTGSSLVASATYGLTVDVHDHIGSMLNDRFISAYVAVDSTGGFLKSDGSYEANADLTKITNELTALINATFKQEGEGFVAQNSAGVITITGYLPEHVVGVKDGMEQPWEVTGFYRDESSNATGIGGIKMPAAVTYTEGVADDLVQLINVEWFNSGYDKDPYRETGYPHSFQADSNIVAAGIAVGDEYGIFQFYKDRDATNVERQHRQLIVVGAAAEALNTVLTTKKA